MDALAEQLVAGADSPGDVLVICGTTLITWAVAEGWPEAEGLWTIPHLQPGLAAIGGPSNAGGLFLERVRTLTGDPADEPSHPDRVPLWVPYIRGERTPRHDPDLRAALVGLDVGHGTADVLAAGYEAAGFVVRHHLDLADTSPSRIVAVGGGTHVERWMQALADATNLPVDVTAVPEGAARGAAWLARISRRFGVQRPGRSPPLGPHRPPGGAPARMGRGRQPPLPAMASRLRSTPRGCTVGRARKRRPMKFAVTFPMVAHPWDQRLITKQGVVDFARTAEESGFDGLGFTDHPAPTDRWLNAGGHDAVDPFAALAFCAAVTDRIKLIPNIVVAPYRNPFIMAKAIATIDAFSDGRFIFATGAGYLKGEFKALGVDFNNRNQIYDEALEAMVGIWTTDDFAYEGSNFTALGQTANPKPVQEAPSPHLDRGQLQAGPPPSGHPRQRMDTVSCSPGAGHHGQERPPLETLDDLWRPCSTSCGPTSTRPVATQPTFDVSYLNPVGGRPADPDFDADAHIAALAELEALGVTWITVNVPGDDIEATLDTMRRYGETVIAPSQSP